MVAKGTHSVTNGFHMTSDVRGPLFIWENGGGLGEFRQEGTCDSTQARPWRSKDKTWARNSRDPKWIDPVANATSGRKAQRSSEKLRETQEKDPVYLARSRLGL